MFENGSSSAGGRPNPAILNISPHMALTMGRLFFYKKKFIIIFKILNSSKSTDN